MSDNTEIPHKKYHHIVNSSVKSKVRKIVQNPSDEATVEEKIDGSNLYFASNGITSIIGRKNGILHESAKFYDFQKVLFLKENIINLHKQLMIPDSIIYLYGELIPTQKRLQYVEPGVTAFIAFDLKVCPASGDSYWLKREVWADVAIKCGFLVNPIIFRGTFDECLDYNVENQVSTVPKLLDTSSNTCSIEGVIIKYGISTFKKKSKAFAEIERGGNAVQIAGISLLEQQVADLISSMLTISRLENVISGIDNDIEPNSLRLANSVVLDAIGESRDDDDCPIHKISKTKVSKIQKCLAAEYSAVVKDHMKW